VSFTNPTYMVRLQLLNVRSILETRVRNRFPPPISLMQLEDVLHEKWYTIPLETVQKLYKSIPRRIAAVLKAKGSPAPY
jgi:hypothetical protein